MKRILLGALLVAAAATHPLAATGVYVRVGQSDAEIEKAVRQMEADFAAALVKGDTSALEAMTAKDYVFINSGGAVVPREMIISDLKSGRLKYHAHDLDDVRVRVYGQTAVVTARVALKATFAGQDISGTYRHTRVYTASGGKWRLVSAHATRVAQ